MNEEISEPSYEVSYWFRKVLVPFDGSGLAKKALALAKDFNYRYGSEVHAVYICDACDDVEEVRAQAMKVFRDVKFTYRRVNLKESSIVNEILKFATEEEYDAVILGSKGNSMNEVRLIGSTALSLVLEFPATVIIIR